MQRIFSLSNDLINGKEEVTDFWDELSPAQQAELRQSIEESMDEKNLVSHAEAMKQLARWIKE